MVKFCKDCKFCAPSLNHDKYFLAKCTREPIREIDMVSGEPRTDLWYCQAARASPSTCGEDAKFFEPITAEVAA